MNRWPKEDIPDEDHVFRRVHRSKVRADGKPRAGAFTNLGHGMSTDWQRYSTPAEARDRSPTPSEYGVLQLRVGAIRDLPGQDVEHTPQQENRAHADVVGEKDEEIRTKLGRIAAWALDPPK